MARDNIKEITFFHFKNAAIVHCHCGSSGNYHAHMFHIAAAFPKRFAHVS
ncbi:MAG: hypothetical protein JOZ14_03570 [Acidobacteria bacterium]|nr:hypothetical protein [Acidobacteriota bacterium]